MSKKFLFYLICSLIAFQNTSLSQQITDIPTDDPNYSYIKQAIKKGYLSLYNDNQFKGDQSLSRKEMAFISTRG